MFIPYSYWENAVEIAKSIGSDHYLYFKAMGGISQIAIFCGGKAHCYNAGKEVLNYGKKHANIRSQVVGHVCMGHSHYSDGNYEEALISYSKALEVAVDPFYTEWARLYLGIVSFIIGELERAEEALTDVAFYIENFGCEIMSSATFPMLGAILISKGEMSKGLELIKKSYRSDQEKKWGYGIGMAEYTLAEVYAQLSQVEEKPKFSILAKNFKFIVQNIPFAFKKSEEYFTKAIETAKTYKAQGILGLAYYKTYGLNFTAMRIFNTYGPRQPRYVLYDFIKKLKNSSDELEILGTGEQKRTYSFVSDTVKAFYSALISNKSNGEVYNIAGEEVVSIKELAQIISSCLNINPTFSFTGESWKGDIYELIGSINKISQDLKFKPSICIKDGISQSIKWFKDNGYI